MEQLNRVELRGIVGSARISEIGGSRVAHITLATSRIFRDRSGGAVIETTWHNVTAWEGPNCCCLDLIERGSRIHLTGRLRVQRYTGADGEQRSVTEIMAERMELIGGDEPLKCQE